ncbi:hypothetical protein CC78DRAFT_534420 [Lojkania enalia]|uniref:Uncharacterized protein n=1 Tax=Lojkania enalia TaxID=147567 RepID=A0A9P4N554_9PLEO|nr:hypothetical protein CC78DRAFT_534420 [Didymosphaeria enalia]
MRASVLAPAFLFFASGFPALAQEESESGFMTIQTSTDGPSISSAAATPTNCFAPPCTPTLIETTEDNFSILPITSDSTSLPQATTGLTSIVGSSDTGIMSIPPGETPGTPGSMTPEPTATAPASPSSSGVAPAGIIAGDKGSSLAAIIVSLSSALMGFAWALF